MARIIVSGGDGRFSRVMKKIETSNEVFFLSKDDMDICSIESIEEATIKYRPDILIHTAALSRPMNIHEEHPEKSISLNIIGTSNCVLMCIKYGIKMVYLSTDFVYPGEIGNYKETDSIFPFNKYAWSKLGGECSCILYENSLILRMSMMENPFPHKRAFTDSLRSNIWHEEAARILYCLVDSGATGIYNIGGEKKSVYDFVRSRNTEVGRDSIKNSPVKVPADVSINIEKIKKILE